MKNYKKLDIYDICGAVCSAESALIICHINPDADSIGCALAMSEIFSLMEKPSKIVCPSPPPKHIAFLTDGKAFEYNENDEDEHSLIISVDVASPAQLGGLSFLKKKVSFMIDHHSNGEIFADNLVVPEAAATGEIIFKIYKNLRESGKIPPSPAICRYLYAALSSDTGSFKYSNTTPETMRIAASLMEEINVCVGIHTDDISRLLHDTVTKTDMDVATAVNSSLTFYENGALAAAVITAEDMKKGGFCESDLGSAVDIPRKIENVLVAAVLKQRAGTPNTYRLSARANCDIDVAAVCEKFGGGGHMRAAGATIEADSPEKALEITAAAFAPIVSGYNNKGRDTLT